MLTKETPVSGLPYLRWEKNKPALKMFSLSIFRTVSFFKQKKSISFTDGFTHLGLKTRPNK